MSSAADFNAFAASITDMDNGATGGDYRFGAEIDFARIPGIEVDPTDIITGDDGADEFAGGLGDDLLNGLGGDDWLSGGDGADQVLGGAGDDTIDGGDGDDVLDGGEGRDVALYSATGGVAIDLRKTVAQQTGQGIDTLTGIESVTSGTGDDRLRGNAEANTLDGQEGDDRLFGMGGADRLFGAGGDDVLEGGVGADLIQGGAGVDTALFGGLRRVTVDLRETEAQRTGQGLDTLSGIENLISGGGDDWLRGDAADNRIEAKRGDDRLLGFGGDDQLLGGDGDDWLEGGAGDDLLQGGLGSDTAHFGGLGAITVDLRVHGPQDTGHGADSLSNIENLISGGGDDRLRGNFAANTLEGKNGDDRLFGMNGADNLSGGGGADRLDGGSGDDVLNGGEGVDTALFGGQTAISVDLSVSGAQQTGHGLDTLIGIENVITGGGDDELRGDDAGNVFEAKRGADSLYGMGGDDVLRAGDGDDLLDGGAGNDRLEGGAGADQFVFTAGAGIDTVTDFEDGVDVILGGAGASDFSQMGIVQVGEDTWIEAAGTTMILADIDASLITEADFLFT